MSGRPTFRWFSAEELIAAAGGDPWAIADQLHAGDPGAIDALAAAFHDAGARVKDADDEFAKARQQFLDSYNRNNGSQHPINDAAEVQRLRTQLAAHPEELTRIGADLEQTAASLASAQRDAVAEIDELNAALHEIDDEINAHGIEIPLVLTQLVGEAEEQTRVSLAHLENVQGAYVDQLHSAETAMVASGYPPTALADADAIPGNSPTEAADQYRRSGQLDRDRATVAKAEAEHHNGGQLGWNIDEVEAQRRLDDYATITDPSNKETSPVWFEDDKEKAESQFLAGERLDDYNVANSTGLVAKDPIMGGDMRDRAKARLTMRRQLQDGQLGWHPGPMNADDATKLMDQTELQIRQSTLTRLQQQLVDCGVSPDGAAAITEGISHGVVPQEYLDAAGAVSKVSDAGERATERFAEALPTGRHWPEGVAFSESDIEALKKFGGKFGYVGTAIDFGTGLYEVFGEGKNPVDVVVKAGGGMAGAWAFGELGAIGGGAVGGPPGAFIGALGLGTVGAFVGENRAEAFMKWIREDG